MHKLKKSFAKRITGFPLILGFFAVLLIPSSASASISNGTFEAETGTSITGWTAINKRIDLGGELIDEGTEEDVVSTIAGCATVDTSDYSDLRGWVEGEGRPGLGDVPDTPVANNDSIDLWDDYEELPTFTTKSVDGTDGSEVSASYQRAGNILKLESDVDTDNIGGYVLHGPAVYSDPFTAKTIDDLTIDWAADSNGDDYHVFGYLLNTSTCEQTEVVDSNGRSSDWQTNAVAVPSNGTYRFVFVAGTFDQSFGTVAGGTMYIDNIVLTVNEERAAEEAAAVAAASNRTPGAPEYPRLDSHSFSTSSSGSPVLTIEGKRFTCVETVSIDGTELQFETGFSTPWYEYMHIDVTGVSPGSKTLVLESCMGRLVQNDWVTIGSPVLPKSMWAKLPAAELNESTKAKIAAFNSSLGDGYTKIRCIVNSSNGDAINESFATQICAFAQSNDVWNANSVIETKDSFAGRGYWINVWVSGN